MVDYIKSRKKKDERTVRIHEKVARAYGMESIQPRSDACADERSFEPVDHMSIFQKQTGE